MGRFDHVRTLRMTSIAVYIGQPKIQQHDVRVVAGSHHDRRFPIGSSQIFIAVGFSGSL